MNTPECVREEEVIDAVRSGRWTASCSTADDELRAHVATCAVCSDVAVVAERLIDERDQAWRRARLPPAGQVWWRITIRARAEAARTAARPITLAQGVGGACAAGVCAALIGLAWPPVGRWLLWMFTAASQEGTHEVMELASSTFQSMWPVIAAVGICVLVMPLALYLVLSDD